MAYKRGDKWVGFYRDAAGRQHTNGNFRRKRDADLWEQEQKSAIRNDTWVDPGRSKMTVGQWSETWMAGRVHLKPKTLSSYRSLLATRVLPTWSTVPLTKIRHSDVVAWVAAMRADLPAARTRQAYHLLSSMLDDAVKDNRLARNPATGVGPPRPPRADRRHLPHRPPALPPAALEAGRRGDGHPPGADPGPRCRPAPPAEVRSPLPHPPAARRPRRRLRPTSPDGPGGRLHRSALGRADRPARPPRAAAQRAHRRGRGGHRGRRR